MGWEGLVFLFFAVLVLGIPVVALIVALQAAGRARQAMQQVQQLSQQLARLQQMGLPAEKPKPTPKPQEAEAPSQPPAPAPAVSPTTPSAPTVTPEVPVTPSAPPPAPPETPAPKPSLEERIGVTWFTRLGAAVLILGAMYFFKYAVDNNWIGPWGRVALGAGLGAAVLIFAEKLSDRLHRGYLQGLLGVGLSLLYVSSFAAYGFYRLVPVLVAFVALTVVAGLGGLLAYRYRSQVTLVMALLAALANPVLLTTGEDRPLGLAAYLLLVTSAAFFVAVPLRFRWALWLAVFGSVVLGVAWFTRFFEVFPPALDAVTGMPVPGSAGAYWTLSARTVPLLAVAAFCAQWVMVAGAARRREWTSLAPRALLLAGVVYLHWGWGALLADRPPALAAAMVVAAGVAVAALRGAENLPLLGLPLAVSFLILAARTSGARQEPLIMLVLVGAWLSVYAVSLVLAAHRTAERATAGVAWKTLAVAGGLALAVMVLVSLPHHPEMLAGAAVLTCLALVLLGEWAEKTWLAWPAGLVAAFGWFLGAPKTKPPEPVFLALAALWAGVYLAAAGRELLRRGEEAARGVVVAAAAAPAAFVAVLLRATPAEAGTTRALVSAAAALAVFAVGVLTLRRHPEARGAASALLGEGVALAALAVVLAFSGVTVTLLWALLAAAVAVLAARARDRRWLLGAGVLFLLSLGRVVFVDAQAPRRELARFLATAGREGALQPTPLLNPKALALAGVAVALLVAARSLGREEASGPWRLSAGICLVIAHGLLLGLVIRESQRLVTQLPRLPAKDVTRDEFGVFWAQAQKSLAAQRTKLAVTATLAMGGYGAVLLGLGFALRALLHRWLGLTVLSLTLGKLVFWDIWRLPRLSQVLVLVAVGVLLLGAGFLYARFGPRLFGFLRTGAGLLALLSWPADPGGAVEVRQFAFKATAVVAAPGLAAVPVPPELYRASGSPGDFADLRILGADGQEVPWVLRNVPAPQAATDLPVELLDPVVFPDGSSQATFDVGESPAPHNQLTLRLEGDEFLRHWVLEVSEDHRQWGNLAEGVVFRVTSDGVVSQRVEVAYPRSAARYLRVTLKGEAGKPPVPVTGGALHFRPPESSEPLGRIPLVLVRREENPSSRLTAFYLDAGASGVPLHQLTLEVADARFERRVTVQGSEGGSLWVPVGGGVLYRAGGAEGLQLPVTTSKRYLRLMVENGDNPPLTLQAAWGEYRLQQLLFEAKTPGSYALYLGAPDLQAPSYDLAASLSRMPTVDSHEAPLGPVLPNPAFAPEAPLPFRPFSERYRMVNAGALLLLLAGLAFWAWRLLRQVRPDAQER